MGDNDAKQTATRETAAVTSAPREQATQSATGSSLQRALQRRLLQRRADAAGAPGAPGASEDTHAVHAAAERGTAGAGSALPHGDAIQRAFGAHDIGDIKAHTGGAAAEASNAMGAEAYATGNQIAFGGTPSLHTAAHEAAHVVQQRGGVQLKGNVGQAGDSHEQHADAVADAVVAGKSAEALLGPATGARGAASGAVQRALLPKRATEPAYSDGLSHATIVATAVDKEPAPKKVGATWAGGVNAAARKSFKTVCGETDITKMDALVADPRFLQVGEVHGNTLYKNSSGDLPGTTTYKEYDTAKYQGDPKLRGSDRIVVGVDGKRYHTADHYKNFAEY